MSVEDIAHPLYEDDQWYLQSAFSPDGKVLYYAEPPLNSRRSMAPIA